MQTFNALANSFDLEDKSQFLIVAAELAIVSSSQQVQAADPVFLIQSLVLFLKVAIASSQVATSVMFG